MLSSLRRVSAVSNSLLRRKHTLPNLPYAYNALEPVISAEIMELHYKKHHATYVNNLNSAEDNLKESLDRGNVSHLCMQPVGVRVCTVYCFTPLSVLLLSTINILIMY